MREDNLSEDHDEEDDDDVDEGDEAEGLVPGGCLKSNSMTMADRDKLKELTYSVRRLTAKRGDEAGELDQGLEALLLRALHVKIVGGGGS